MNNIDNKESNEKDLIAKLLKENLSGNFSDEYINNTISTYYSTKDNIPQSLHNSKSANYRTKLTPESTAIIGEYAIDWCYKKAKNNEILFDVDNCNSQRCLIRFTTKEMERIIPGRNNPDSKVQCWKYRHWFYEIDLRGNARERMWISLTNRHDNVNSIYEKMFKYSGLIIKNDSWDWKSPWKSKNVPINSIKSKEQLFDILDNQFVDLKKWESSVIKFISK